MYAIILLIPCLAIGVILCRVLARNVSYVTIGLFAASFLSAVPQSAEAHVKWFAPYNVAGAPKRLEMIVCNTALVELLVFAILLFFITCSLERTSAGRWMLRLVDLVFADLRLRTEVLVRSGVGAFFVGAWVSGGFILTPELKTTIAATSWLQAAIALGMFWRSTMVFSSLGVIILFAQGVHYYGIFHMMDYPIFLGVAGYLALTGAGRDQVLGIRALDFVRWGAAITLMWASVEKWAYPEWTYPILAAHETLTMGLDPKFFMVASGVVEFSLAFGLLWTPLVRRLSAIVLTTMFVSAILEFGKTDALGHLLIIVVLLVLAAEDRPSERRSVLLAPLNFAGALATTILIYYAAHTLLFGTPMS
jgi:hypothetical protein